LDDQVRQRLELAEMAVEGAELEETTPDIRQIVQQVEGIVGLRLQIDQENDLELDRLREMLPDLVEASMGLRVWAAMVQAVEGRIGEKLELEPSLPIPIDWDQAEKSLQDAFQDAWDARVDQLLKDIARDLDLSLSTQEINRVGILRMLIQMSFGQRTLFDRKTHQRRSISVARFSYPFFAAQLIEMFDEEQLFDEIAGHLNGAKAALERLLGQSEINRLANTKIVNLDEKLKAGIGTQMGSEFLELDPLTEIHQLPANVRKDLANAIGQLILTEAHRGILLSVGDRLWVDYLTQIEALRTSIGLEAYGQRDPLVQYKSRAFDMFQQLLVEVRSGVVSRLFRIQMTPKTSAKVQSPIQSRAVQITGEKPPKKKKRKRRRKR
jgi:preprotein translocase subunit SecA